MRNNLLLVDNDISSRNTFAPYLSRQGFKIHTASSVKIAMAYMRKATPDLIISDITMPQFSGYEFLRMLKKIPRYSAIPFIFLTSKDMTGDKICGYNCGCHAYLTKSIDHAELLAVINSVLHNYRTHQDINYLKLRLLLDNSMVVKFFCQKFNFTEREISVFALVLRGKPNKEISSTLMMSIRNTENYVGRLLRKTRRRNRTELVGYFYCYRLSIFIKGE